MSKKAHRIFIIGAGNMGTALAKGLSKKDTPHQGAFEIAVYDTHQEKARRVAQQSGATAQPNLFAVPQYDAVVLCIKPQDLPVVAKSLAGKLAPETLVLSLLAGTSVEKLASALNWQGPIVRSMPNIAAKVNAAITALCTHEQCEPKYRELADLIFSGIGRSVWVEEHHMDTVTGLSGSGPAYLFMVIEALIDGGVRMGLPRQIARDLTVQTVLGAAELVAQTELHPAILKDQVTTPAGTTIHALHELESRGLRAMLMSAVETATKCSRSLV